MVDVGLIIAYFVLSSGTQLVPNHLPRRQSSLGDPMRDRFTHLCVRAALIGLKLWKGKFRYSCLPVVNATATNSAPDFCICDDGFECRETGNPNAVNSFDNIGAAGITVFQVRFLTRGM